MKPITQSALSFFLLNFGLQFTEAEEVKPSHGIFSAYTSAPHSGIIYEVQSITSYGLCTTVEYNEIHLPGAVLPVVTEYEEHISLPIPNSEFEYVEAVNQFGEPVDALFMWNGKLFESTPCPIVYVVAPSSLLLYEASGAKPLINTSNRATVKPGNPAIAGFILNEPSWIIVRGIAPSMRGEMNTISDPVITLYSDTYLFDDFNDDLEHSITNDGWETTLRKDTLEYWKLAPQSPAEAALVTYLNAGAYTVHLGSKGDSGAALVEVFVAPYSLPIYQTDGSE